MNNIYKLLFAILLIGSISTLQAQITVSYGYDELHRLKICTYSNGIIVNYNYDALGNRTTVVVSGVSSCIPPSNLSVSNIGSTGATVNWNYTSGQTYTVEYKASTSSTWVTASTSVSSGSYTLTGLSANTTYNWRVKANCNTTYVDGANFTTLANCVAVTDLNATNITTNAVTLNWTYTAGYSYTLEWKLSSSSTWTLASSSVNLGTFTGSGLSPNTSYDFRVKSNCSANFTDTIRITTLNNCTYPTANFSYSTNSLAVVLNNTSSNATSYSWNFGNGQTSTQQNPSVTYSTAGTYNICLTATNSCGSTNYCQNVTVSNTCVKPTAQFTYVSNGLTTNFTNSSLNGVTYNWNFGNGQTSTMQHPSITYSTAGTYNVCLTATNSCDTNKVCKMIAVSTCDTVNKYDIYNVINTVPQINKEGYFYYNGVHYLVWSNGHYSQSNPNNSYDAKVKLSTSTDGKTWNTQDILNTTIGSTNHVMTIDSAGKIHIAYVEGTTPNYWGLQYGRLVYANNVSGTWKKIDSTLGTGNGNSYNWSSPYHLMFGYDGKLRMYYTNAGWFAYGGPLYMRVYNGSTWNTPVTIANTNDGGADSQNNLWSFTKKSNGQIQVYLSDGWKCTGNGCTEAFYNNMRVYTEGANNTYTLTKNMPNTRWYYENQMGDSIKVQTDGKTVSVNNVLLNTLSGTEIIRNNTWIDNTKQYAIENTNTNSRVFKVTTGQSIVNNIGQYIIPANGFQIAVDYGSNPRRLYTIHQGNNTSIIANFNSTANNLDVTFTNTTTNAITYNWSFGNGQTSTQLNPTITYTTAGNYDVCLVASNTCNSVQVCKQVSVTCPVPFANFSNTVNNTNVVFTNNSTNATSYNWNFGNGQTSTQVNPSINYGNGGNYTVCLRATNTCGFDDTCKNINIVITSITQNQLDNLISIFPNPNNGTFSVKMDKTLTSNVELAIYDVEGRVVHEQAISQQETAVSTVNLPSGVYIINIRMADDKIIKHKLVIMR